MLRVLHLRNTGPSPQLDAEFAERLNVFTGDNGLGKSFLLDVVWWTLTGSWAGLPAAPLRLPQPRPTPLEQNATISFARMDAEQTHERVYRPQVERWGLPSGKGPVVQENPPRAIVVYARVDGGISIWDPLRNNWIGGIEPNEVHRLLAPPGRFSFRFTPDELWNGLKDLQDQPVCNGLIHDWTLWQLQESSDAVARPFETLRALLTALSPAPSEQLLPGKPVRVSRQDPRDFPTLQFPHAVIPIIHASAGMRRILSLAYALVWAWHEHLQAAALANEEPVSSIVFLVDEIEAHLHPQWQRRILPALLHVLSDLLRKGMQVQLMATTHAPLVLASLEPHFDSDRDRLFHFGLESNQVTLHEEYWAKEGDTSACVHPPQAQARRR